MCVFRIESWRVRLLFAGRSLGPARLLLVGRLLGRPAGLDERASDSFDSLGWVRRLLAWRLRGGARRRLAVGRLLGCRAERAKPAMNSSASLSLHRFLVMLVMKLSSLVCRSRFLRMSPTLDGGLRPLALASFHLCSRVLPSVGPKLSSSSKLWRALLTGFLFSIDIERIVAALRIGSSMLANSGMRSSRSLQPESSSISSRSVVNAVQSSRWWCTDSSTPGLAKAADEAASAMVLVAC